MSDSRRHGMVALIASAAIALQDPTLARAQKPAAKLPTQQEIISEALAAARDRPVGGARAGRPDCAAASEPDQPGRGETGRAGSHRRQEDAAAGRVQSRKRDRDRSDLSAGARGGVSGACQRDPGVSRRGAPGAHDGGNTRPDARRSAQTDSDRRPRAGARSGGVDRGSVRTRDVARARVPRGIAWGGGLGGSRGAGTGGAPREPAVPGRSGGSRQRCGRRRPRSWRRADSSRRRSAAEAWRRRSHGRRGLRVPDPRVGGSDARRRGAGALARHTGRRHSRQASGVRQWNGARSPVADVACHRRSHWREWQAREGKSPGDQAGGGSTSGGDQAGGAQPDPTGHLL